MRSSRPAEHRRDLLVTIDGAGSSHKVIEHLTTLGARPGFTADYSVGFNLDARVKNAISLLPESAWAPAPDSKGSDREDAAIAEVTGLLREGYAADKLGTWPAGTRILVRREPVEEGKQLSLFEQTNGFRYQPFATNTGGGQIQKTRGPPPRPRARRRLHPLREDGPLALAEPQTLRYRLLHTGARIIKRARKQVLRIPETWPWAQELAAAFNRVLAIP